MSIPTTMQAVIAVRPGDPEVLQAVQRPVPRPGPGEVLLRVAAAGVNRPDLMQRRGTVPVPAGATDILGLEAAGEVVAVGLGVSSLEPGQKVMALLNGGGYAEYCLAIADHCLAIPSSLTLEEAGALPEAAFTVWHNLFERGGLRPGETVLIHGGTSGVGTLAIQMAQATGARTVATAGSPEKVQFLQRLGAACAIDYKRENFVEAALKMTDGRGVDVVLDIIGGSYVPRNLAALAPGGRHVSLSFMESAIAQLDLSVVMRKELTLTSSTLRPKSREEKTRLARAVERHVLPLVASGQVRPQMHAVLPIAQAVQAHLILESTANLGKVVLIPGAV